MAREHGLTVDVAVGEFDKLMEEQRARARAAQKKEVIALSQIENVHADKIWLASRQLEIAGKSVGSRQASRTRPAVILDTFSVNYAEMGGQVWRYRRIGCEPRT